jgi:hypothetical protein
MLFKIALDAVMGMPFIIVMADEQTSITRHPTEKRFLESIK